MGEIANNAAQPEPNGIDYDCIDKQLLAVVVECIAKSRYIS